MTPAERGAGQLRDGEAAPELTVGPITRTHIVRYAGASGDFTPIHHDELLAQSVGLPGVFAMGMMHAGMMAHLVADWLGLANVRRYRVRFEDRVWPGDTLTFGGRVVSVQTNGATERVEVEVSCHKQDGRRALSGTALAEYRS